ncbi:MAG: START domain-containing protein [Myxococcota bacterium]
MLNGLTAMGRIRMMKTNASRVVLAFLLTAPIVARAADADWEEINFEDWEEINFEDDIQVFRRDVPGSDLVAFGGVTVMDAPLENILWVLATNDRRKEWVDRLYISTILEQSTPYDYVVYQAFELPVILANRDYVYHARVVRDALSGVVRLEMSSIEHPDSPETVGVRANLINSRYTLTPIGPNKTGVAVEIHTDPRGWLPTWLVNIIQKSWPLKTLSGLRNQVAKPYVRAYSLPPQRSTVAAAPED